MLPVPRLTPWVGRLIAANAVVLLLSLTIFTPASVAGLGAFDPAVGLARPWTVLTYMFVHGGILHLAGNMLALFMFGSPVESRMGSRQFLLFYLYCGLGAALFALGLAQLTHVGPFIGASGAVLGVAVAFAMFWPEAEVLVFPIPIPLKAKTLVALLVAFDFVAGLVGWAPGVAHVAHIGGAIAGYLFFRLQSISQRGPVVATPGSGTVERVVMVQTGARDPEPARVTPVTPMRPRRRIDADPVAAEVDRVLDKISEKGIASLTPAERRFLDEVSRRKKGEAH
ncbi:MAG TPA: rhomboid family intramembrane serine protease [Gemmatimonadales bacterium]|nr:rhomboid family intramembrane serine protease [Gemmatimonadales bacterium]